MQPFPNLFSPLVIGTIEVRNRIMRTATTSNLAEKQRVTPRIIEFYRRLASGGVGSIVTESVAVHPSYSGGQGTLQLYDRDGIPGLTRLTDAVRSEGARFFCQLRHGGRQHHARQTPMLWAPSAIPCPHSGVTPHAMTASEVREVIDGFVQSALNAQAAGFDGVEIQGGNGHLIQEFISSYSNHRDDEYGGDADRRLRFARDIIREVRAAVGADYVVGYRLGVDEFTPDGGITLEDSLLTATEFAGTGSIDYMSTTQGNFYSIETHLPDRRFRPNTFVLSHHSRVRAAVRAVSTIPVVACGRVRDPAEAETFIADGAADMIGMCRQLLADPDWPEKARTGQAETIRRCTNGNHCWSKIRSGDPIGCEVNPEAGREAELGELATAPTRKRVVVVGAGPAGMEVARTAARRGHDVLVMERESGPGGELATAPDIDGFRELKEYVGSVQRDLEAAQVVVRYGIDATAAIVTAEHPDAVVIAVGAARIVPSVPGDGSVAVMATVPAVTGRAPNTLVLFDEDGDTWAAAEAERAASLGFRVLVVTRFFEAFRDMPIVGRITTLKRLDELNVETVVNTEVSRIEAGGVLLRHAYSGRLRRVDDVSALMWVGRRQARNELFETLRARGVPVQLAGDAYAPRRLFNATQDGHRIGRAL